MGNPILKASDLSKYYTGQGSVVVGLNSINLSFEVGEFVAVTGESGSGKSTLGHVLGGIIPYEGGELLVVGKPTSHYDGTDWEEYRRDRISFISQSYGILPGSSVIGNVISALLLSGVDRHDAKKKATEILKKVELYSLRQRKAAKLSSGQKQRLSIARALAKPSKILIADEPTGNLDAQNSREIIKLLAKAAEDRLVILITHEFSEAEDYATRRITLRDGRVVSDVSLRENYRRSEDETEEKRDKKAKKPLFPYIAFLQMRSRPIWSFVMLLFFILTAFSVFAFLGNLIVALDDTPTKIYDNSAFQNGDPTRIVVARLDGADFTEEDYRTLVNLRYVKSLERYGYIADINAPYREDVDYRIAYNAVDLSDGSSLAPNLTVSKNILVLNEECFAKTVPVLPDGEEFLKAGRLPKAYHEVVLYGDESLIGTSIRLVLEDRKNWGRDALIVITADIVGVTDYEEGIYVSDKLARTFTSAAMSGEVVPNYFGVVGPHYVQKNYEFGEYSEEGGTFLAHSSFLESYSLYIRPGTKDFIFMMGFKQYDGTDIRLRLVDAHASTMQRYYELAECDYEKLVSDRTGDQVTLYMKDYAYTDRVIEDIGEHGYIAISPYREGSTVYDEEKYAERTQTLIICAVVLVVLIALQIIVERAMFGMQTESYKLLSDIGLLGKTATRSLYMQVTVFTLLGELLGFGGIYLLSSLGVTQVANVMKHLPPLYMAFLALFHFTICLLTGAWAAKALERRVFPRSAKARDLIFDDVEEDAV